MKTIVRLVVLFIFLLTALTSFSQVKYSQVKISLPKSKVARLQESGVDFDHGHYDNAEKTLTVSIPATDIVKVQKLGFRVQVLVDDEIKHFLRRNPKNYKYRETVSADARFSFSTPGTANEYQYKKPAAFTLDGSMGGYYTYSQMITKINQMKASYPNLVDTLTIGGTYGGKRVLSVKISDNATVNEAEAEVLYTGMHHSREPMGMMNLIFYMQYLLENYNSNALIKDLVNSRELFFIPLVNPDGYERNYTTNPSGGGLHRKNVRLNPGSTNPGVDLNRNYGFAFGYDDAGSSPTPSNHAYRGPSAFCEAETVAIKNFLNTRQFRIAINYHAYGAYWIHGFCVPSAKLSATDSVIIKTTGSLMTKHNVYELGTPQETVGYSANGTTEDWYMAGDPGVRSRIYAFSPEIGPSTLGFWPTVDTIVGLCRQVMFANLQAAYLGGSMAKIEDKTSLSVAAPSGSFSFAARRLGILDSAVKVTLIPVAGIASVGAPVIINSIPVYRDTAVGSIPYTLNNGLATGQLVRYVWRMQSAGITIDDTVSKFYNLTPVLSENGESLANWVPGGTWGLTNDYAVSGSNSFTDSPDTTYKSSTNSTLTYKNGIDLSNATAAYLSFWVRHRTQNGMDRLRIQAASNLTSPTWQSLAGEHTITENKGAIGSVPSLTGEQEYWVRERVNLKSFLGSSNVGLRFQFISDADSVNDGFYIDDVEVVRTTTTALPVKVQSFGGEVTDNTPVIHFRSQTDAGHSHFELERSADGLHFTAIATIAGKENFDHADSKAGIGSNYYRVKLVSKDGAVEYTRVIKLNTSHLKSLVLSPVPAVNQVTVRIQSLAAQEVTLRISDALGRDVSAQKMVLTAGTNTHTLDISKLNRQTYYLRISNTESEIIGVEKFVKN